MNAEKLVQHDLFGAKPIVCDPNDRRDQEAAAARFRELSKPDMLRITPSTSNAPAVYVPKPGTRVPDLVLARWSELSDGRYHLVPVAGRWARLSTELCTILGFRDMNRNRKYETMMRLGRAGYIEIVKVSPGCWMLDLDTWWRHIADCMESPEMWDEGSEERANYLQKNGLGGWKKNIRQAKKRHTRLGKAVSTKSTKGTK